MALLGINAPPFDRPAYVTIGQIHLQATPWDAAPSCHRSLQEHRWTGSKPGSDGPARAALAAPQPESRWAKPIIREQFAIIATCRDEAHQVELLRRFGEEALECKALLS
jgi:hypothetical protein